MFREVCGSKPPEPLNQPWGQTTPKGTETALLMVLETSLQPCLSLPHLVYHPGKSSSLDSVGLGLGLETVVGWRGRVSTAAVCAGTLAMGELGPGIVGAQPVLENIRGHWHWSSRVLDQPPEPTRCQALTTPCRAD